jgi:hypothetical protein
MPQQPEQQATNKQSNQFKEVRIPISLKGFFKAWDYVTRKKPISIFQTITRKIEGFSKKMMTGKTSFIGMPLGIILRNTSRAAHNLSDSKYGGVAEVAGGLAAIAAIAGATMVAGPIVAGALGIAGWMGLTLAAPVAGLVLAEPVYTAGKLTASSIGGAGAFAFSTLISAPANLGVAYRRSKASFSGIDLEKQLAADEAKFDSRSPSANYQRDVADKAASAFDQLDLEKQESMLKGFFEKVTQRRAAEDKKHVAPASKRGGPATQP